MLPGCCCCCLHRRRPLAFTFLREEKEEAGPHLIQLLNFGSDNFSNFTPLVTASSPELRICECRFKKEVYRVHFLGRGGGQVTPDTTWQLVNPGIWFFGVSLWCTCALYHGFSCKKIQGEGQGCSQMLINRVGQISACRYASEE